MRVWVFPSFYPYDYPDLQMTGIFTHRQVKGLIQNGAEVNVVQPVLWYPMSPFHSFHKDWQDQKKLNYPAHRIYDGVNVYHPKIKNLKPGKLFRKPYGQRYTEAILNFFRKNKIVLDPENDIIYSQWLPEAGYVQAAAKELGIKSTLILVGDDVLKWPHRSKHEMDFFIKTMEHADARFCVADYLGNEANKLVGRQLPFITVHRGVNHKVFKPVAAEEKMKLRAAYKLPENKVIILSIGTAIIRKGWLDLFDAMVAMKKTTDNFVLVGVHEVLSELDIQSEVIKRGLQNNFIHLGEVSPQEIHNVYNIADVFCLASHWEGIANCVAEALSTGLPVITTNVCGHPEIIMDGVTGILVPPKQPAILAEKLLLLINDGAKRKSLGESARNFIINEWGDFAQNAGRLYQKLKETLEQ